MAYPRRRRPAALSALYLAFFLGLLGSIIVLLIRDSDLLADLTLTENLTVLAVVVGLWLIFWPIIAASRRRRARARGGRS